MHQFFLLFPDLLVIKPNILAFLRTMLTRQNSSRVNFKSVHVFTFIFSCLQHTVRYHLINQSENVYIKCDGYGNIICYSTISLFSYLLLYPLCLLFLYKRGLINQYPRLISFLLLDFFVPLFYAFCLVYGTHL